MLVTARKDSKLRSVVHLQCLGGYQAVEKGHNSARDWKRHVLVDCLCSVLSEVLRKGIGEMEQIIDYPSRKQLLLPVLSGPAEAQSSAHHTIVNTK